MGEVDGVILGPDKHRFIIPIGIIFAIIFAVWQGFLLFDRKMAEQDAKINAIIVGYVKIEQYRVDQQRFEKKLDSIEGKLDLILIPSHKSTLQP